METKTYPTELLPDESPASVQLVQAIMRAGNTLITGVSGLEKLTAERYDLSIQETEAVTLPALIAVVTSYAAASARAARMQFDPKEFGRYVTLIASTMEEEFSNLAEAMGATPYYFNRDVTQKFWGALPGPFAKGEIVYKYPHHDHGLAREDMESVGVETIACSLVPSKGPFFTIPVDMLVDKSGQQPSGPHARL